jgi:phosphopantetheinyl transferase (holo-ACP synthase)
MKAHRHRRLTWHDIWIRGRESQYGMTQAPEALIISEDGNWEDAQIVSMSISHDEGYATAVCMAFEPELGVDSDVDGDLRAPHGKKGT